MTAALIIALVLPWLLIAALVWLLFLLVRQHGRALTSQQELRDRMAQLERSLAERPATAQPAPVAALAPAAANGLPLGTPAPDFALADLSGRERRLADFKGRRRVLTFFGTACGFCLQMAPRLGQWQGQDPGFLLISNGDPEQLRRLQAENNWQCDVLVAQDASVMTAYRTTGTPTGYLLDEEGKIASNLAIGADALFTLAESVKRQPGFNGHGGLTLESLREKEQAASGRAQAAGLAVRESTLNRQGLAAGTPAPEFRLSDLKGKKRRLSDYRGKPVLLVFSDPDCGPCQALAPQLEQLHQRVNGTGPEVVMVSRGDLQQNRLKVKEQGLTFPVLLQKQWEVSKDYAMFATPVGYLIDELGVITKDVAVGADAILNLV